ncbi:MAG: hypothetical protein AB1798_00325 [Spirochaetota bacterium]
MLRRFIKVADYSYDLPESGRSQPSIFNLANYLIDWVMSEHPVTEARDALSPPYIKPLSPNDEKPNPPDDPSGVKLLSNKYNLDQEIEAVVKSIEEGFPTTKIQPSRY